MPRSQWSFRLLVAIAGAITLSGCSYGVAHRVPGTDMALPATSYGDQILLALARPCQIAQSPDPSVVPKTGYVKQECPMQADTAIGQAGTVARGPTRVP